VAGKRVRLEYDQQRQDKYGRTLAYVYLENGTFVNAEIIRQGYGFAYTRYPFKYLSNFGSWSGRHGRQGAGCGEPNDGDHWVCDFGRTVYAKLAGARPA
jgi:hypothetical protein